MHLLQFMFILILIFLINDHIVLSLQVSLTRHQDSSKVLPDNFDWRTRGVVTPVQDYSDTPHVAAVVMVESIETLHAIKTGNLQRGSVARVIDCCAKNIITYECIRQMGGICIYDDYPTILGQCETNACKPFASFDTMDHFREENDSVLLPFIQKSSLLVGIDASQRSFEQYSGGIYKDKNCSQIIDTHALQIVGYGTSDTGEPYWIARNSWGEDWGENGYIRILRGENICGIGTQVYQPGILPVSKTSSLKIKSYFPFILFYLFFCLH